MQSSQRSHWSSRFSFILVASGSAVGLGNIWKFPYITGEHGGGAFVLVYLACITLVNVPIFIAELFIGQKSQADAVTSFEKLHKPKTPWRIAGAMGIISSFIILSFYSVVGGWVLDFEFKSLFNQFAGKSDTEIGGMLSELFASPLTLLMWHFVFMVMTVGIVVGGISRGIEKWGRILMPALFFILIGLLVWCTRLDGFGQAIDFLFTPDFSKLDANSILVALGHSFFTLSLGLAAMITYGSYLDQKEDLVKASLAVGAADTIIALASGIVIFSVVFSFGLEPNAGPGLMFSTLPMLFNKIPGGYFISTAFFLLVAFAALSSSISLLETGVTYFVDRLGMGRTKVTILSGAFIYLLGVLSALSFNVLADFKIGKFTFFDLFDGLTTNIMLPLGGMIISLFYGWVLGREGVKESISGHGGELAWKSLMWTARIFAPACILWVLYSGASKWLFS